MRVPYRSSQKLFAKLQAFRKSLTADTGPKAREEMEPYLPDTDVLF